MILIKKRSQGTTLMKISFLINGIEIPENECPFHHRKCHGFCVFDVKVMNILTFF